MKPNNPFVIVGYSGPEYFCDRANESRKMMEAITNDRNLTLIAPRRYGKTGLIHHVFQQLPSDYSTAILDIFATKNLSEFTQQFVEAIVGSLDTPVEKTLATVAKFFKNCRPTVTPQDDGRPSFSFDIAPDETRATLHDAFEYLRSHERRTVIAIDEFQQILEYPETGTEALLRGYVQEVPWVRFVFSGSRHHLMGEMFMTAKHPFYQSTDILSLDVIEREKYAEFASHHFAASSQPFERAAFDALYEQFNGVTWYVQSVLNRIWLAGGGFTDAKQIKAVIRDLVNERALIFRDLYFSQSEAEQDILKAIAAEGEAHEVFSGDFLHRHPRLKSTSTIRSALNSLIRADIVYRTATGGYIVYDRLFGEWLRKIS